MAKTHLEFIAEDGLTSELLGLQVCSWSRCWIILKLSPSFGNRIFVVILCFIFLVAAVLRQGLSV